MGYCPLICKECVKQHETMKKAFASHMVVSLNDLGQANAIEMKKLYYAVMKNPTSAAEIRSIAVTKNMENLIEDLKSSEQLGASFSQAVEKIRTTTEEIPGGNPWST